MGIISHITPDSDFNKSYNPTDFYYVSRDDILHKISSLSSQLDERDFELAISKPLLPIGFKIKPDIQSGHRAVKVGVQSPIISPSIADNQNDADTQLEKIIATAQSLADQADNIVSLKFAIDNFKSMQESQKLALKTLAYHDAETIDILWINDAVSSDDDRQQGIMSDNAGQMIVRLFDYLGYGRNKPHKNGQIGYTSLSFWPLMPSDATYGREYQICLPFIKRLIYFLNPKKIILSGNIPLQYLVQADDAFKHHGKKFALPIDDKIFDCYSVFNLSYILHSEVTKKIFWFDLLTILHDTENNYKNDE